MLKKILKITSLVLLGVIVIAAGFLVKVYVSTENRMNKHYTVVPQDLEIPADSATLAYGKRLITTKGCDDCHGADLGGRVFIDDKALGFLVARNLTEGKGGLPPGYSVSDWLLALKHGIRKDGKPLLFMPSHEYALLSEGDVRAIIAYCMQVPPVDRELPASSVGPLGRVLTDLGKFPLLPAEMIDHSKGLSADVVPAVTVEYGKYLSNACQGCHRQNMKGGDPIGPGFPPVADISSTGNPGKWTDDEFIKTLRTGHTPEGRQLNPRDMPWTMTRAYTDLELQALHLYLKSI